MYLTAAKAAALAAAAAASQQHGDRTEGLLGSGGLWGGVVTHDGMRNLSLRMNSDSLSRKCFIFTAVFLTLCLLYDMVVVHAALPFVCSMWLYLHVIIPLVF